MLIALPRHRFFAYTNGLAMNSFFAYANGLAMNNFFVFANGFAMISKFAKQRRGRCIVLGTRIAHGTYIAKPNKKEELITPHQSTYIVLFRRLLA